MAVSKAIDLYRQLVKFPQAVSARVSRSSNSDYDVIDTVQTQRDLERAEKIKSSRSYIVKEAESGKFNILHRSQPQELANEIWNKASPSNRYRAVVRKVTDKKKEEKQYIEIWEGNTKIENFDITAADKHGKLYDPDVYFGCLEWSNKEDKLLYVAEKKYKKAVSFFKKSSGDEKEDAKTEPKSSGDEKEEAKTEPGEEYVVKEEWGEGFVGKHIPVLCMLTIATGEGEEYVVKEEWGEGFVGKHIPVLCMLTIATGEVTVLEGVPENLSAGQAKCLPGDEKIVFTGWDHEPYRLGIIYCPIRKGTLYTLELKSGTCTPITPSDRASKCCVLSPDKKSFVFLDTNIGGPHMQCSRLLKYNLETDITTIVTEEVQSVKGDEFPGLYCLTLPGKCWSTDGKRVVMNTIWGCYSAAIVVNTETKKITRIPSDCGGDIVILRVEDDIVIAQCSAPNRPHYLVGRDEMRTQFVTQVMKKLPENSMDCGGDIVILRVEDDIVIAQCSAPNRPHYLVVGRLPQVGKEMDIVWTTFEEKPTVLENIAWKINKHTPTPERVNPKYSSLYYESTLVYNKSKGWNEKKNFVVFPHGGPHSVFTLEYSLYVSFLCELGFDILMVNYRGSVGYGMDMIHSLPGRIGDQDVKDCQAAAEEVIKNEGYDKDRVVVGGGSHGGFLTAHLVGQYPGFYKAGLCRNPVINIATMSGSTDIPDWAFVEAGYDFDFKSLPDGKTCEQMWKCSPLQYVDQISCPMMIMLGLDDKRCPIKQGNELYKALKARNKPVRYIAYPDNGHPIVKVDSEADAFINVYKWFTEHLPQ